MKNSSGLVVMVLTGCLIGCNGQSQTYRLTDLGALIGADSYAQGINNQGQVVGYWDATNGAHAFLYQAGTVTDLGLLGVKATNNFALSINNAGQVVGFAETATGARAFLYQNGSMTNLGNFNGLGSYAFGINRTGQIAGYVGTPNGSRAVLYDKGDTTDLGTLGGTNSFAFGVNDSLQVAGSSLTTNNAVMHAFLWQNGWIADLNQLQDSGWELSEANGINDLGNIVGWGAVNQQAHAFLYYSGGLVTDLGMLPGGTNSYALGLNNSNQVVGVSSTRGGNHAVVWQSEAVKDLNTLSDAAGWVLREASGINDLGQIVGWGMVNGQGHAYLLTPINASTASKSFATKAQQAFTSPAILAPGGSLTILITNPVNNAVIIASQTNLTLAASAADSIGTVTQVQFFQGSTRVGLGTNSPYNLVWNNVLAGGYGLTAVAFDDGGNVATSAVVNITITSLFSTNALRLWLKGDALTGLTDDAPMATWPDSSGWRSDATQISANRQPIYRSNSINGYPVVHYNGSSHNFNLPNFLNGATGAEAFVVLKAASANPAGNQSLWQIGSAVDWTSIIGNLYPGIGGNLNDDFGSALIQHEGVPGQSLTEYHVYEVTSLSNNFAAWINGVLQYQNGVNVVGFTSTPYLGYYTWFSPYVGGYTGYFAGDMAEVIIFSRELTAGERATVNQYLNGKYGLVPDVPVTPTNLVARGISPTQIGLTWHSVQSGGATRISIERSTAMSGPFSVVAQVSEATSYLDTNAEAGTTYFYQVRAINLAQWSPYSVIASATALIDGAGLPVSSLSLWLKADGGMAQGGANVAVNLWLDQSGKGNHASQSAGGNQPLWVPGVIGDRPVVRFNGTNSYFNLPNFLNGATGAEAFVVLKAASANPVSNQSLWQIGSAVDWTSIIGNLYPGTGGNINDDFGSTVIQHEGVPGQTLTQFHVYHVTSLSNNFAAWFNGVLQYQNGVNAVGFTSTPYLGYYTWFSPYVGGYTGYFAGDIAEVLVFNRALSLGEKAAVGNYLNAKYALVQNAPTSPAKLTAAVSGTAQVSLAWSNTATIPAGIQIERKTDAGGVYAVIAEVRVGVVNYTDSNLASGHQYFYRIRASNLAGYSPYSNEAIALLNTPPAVTLSSPANGALFVSPANITLVVTAADSDGTITNVVFLAGGTNSLGAISNSPFTLTWSNVPTGTYSLTARATDNLGAAADSPAVVITVSNPPPSVILTAPTNNQFYLAPAVIALAATATDPNGTILKVEFFSAATNRLGTLANSPYAMNWTNLATGNYPLTAVATDNEGATRTSSVVNISVSNRPPSISLTSPANNALFQAPGTVPLAVSTSDANGNVVKVDYYYRGTNLIGSSAVSPFGLVWNNAVAGTNFVTAKATDNGGASTTSGSVTVIVNAQPSVSITSPVNFATFSAGSGIAINAAASDADGTISRVDFYYGANILLGSDTSAPYSIVFNNAPPGTYPLTARATDNRGGVMLSSAVMISVSTNLSDSADSYVRDGSYTTSNFGTAKALLVQTNGTAGNNEDAYFKFDTSGFRNVASATLNLYAAASAKNTTVGVAVYGAGTNWTETGITWSNRPALGALIGSTTIVNNSYVWYVLNLTGYVQSERAAGRNVISLVLHGIATSTANVSINSREANSNRPFLQLFTSNSPPVVNIIAPANNTVFIPSTNVTITASAADSDGSIYKVEFFQGSTSLGIRTNAPYAQTWTNVPFGEYVLTAVATDNLGATTTSASVNLNADSSFNGLDPDGDGLTNLEEWLLGTNPQANDASAIGTGLIQIHTPLK